MSATIGREFRKIRERYESLSTDAHEVSRLMGQDPEMQAIIRQMSERVHEVSYESADEEDPHGTPELIVTGES